ncbi:hypothetical protein LguiA_006082 [Lonicera macranthoides]
MAAYYPPPPGSQYPSSYYPPPAPQQPPLGVVQPPLQPQYHLPAEYHHHHQHFPAYAPQPSSYQYHHHHPQYSHDEVRTLFVAGLPEDVKAREVYNLFREFPGYESSHLRSPTAKTQPFAFAVFVDQPSAVVAKHELNGMVFDLEKNSTLYVDLAKSNSRSKRSRTDGDRPGSDKRTKGSASFSRGIPDSGVGSVHMPGMGNSAYNMIGYPSTQSHGNFDGSTVNETTATMEHSSAPYIPQDVNSCPTLFVADLGPTCTEEELIQVFSRFPGYLKLKMQSTYGAPVAFVDFQDAACSSEARNRLQGTILYSSPPGKGLRLEYPFEVKLSLFLLYARSRMGMRGRKSR